VLWLGLAWWLLTQFSAVRSAPIDPAKARALRLYESGVENLRSDHLTAAEMDLIEATRTSPEFVEAWVNLSAVRLRTGDVIGAEDAARRAVRVLPNWGFPSAGDGRDSRSLASLAHGNLAISLLRLGRLDEAAESARKSLELDADNPTAATLRAIANGGLK
jgi:Flp pilus assembly protein TadD